MRRIERALLSVSDKSGVVELARALVRHGAQVLSTGGTAALLEQEGVPVVQVSRYTGAREILGGRVKTLHPRVAGGLLARRDDAVHRQEMAEDGILPIDLVAVTLYPFDETVRRPDVSLEEAVEEIDVGGVTMLRAAAKNQAWVAAITDPADYGRVIEELDRTGGALSRETRSRLAVKAFECTARYDAAVASWLRPRLDPQGGFPLAYTVGGTRVQDLRYGENPHQAAAFYRTSHQGFGAARQLQGKELSYNNLIDLDAAVALARDLKAGSAVVVKHTNPCGAATGRTLAEAYRRARETDPVSAFGGVVALGGVVDEETATELTGTFIEAVAAPGFTAEALERLAAKKSLRALEMPFAEPEGLVPRAVAGGLLVQTPDRALGEVPELRVVTARAPDEAETRALQFAWLVAKHVKSNAIVFASERQTLGIGAGQMSRVDSARIAAQKAVLPLRGSAVASDAFFPFRDGLDEVASAGARSVIQPGGSVRDAEVIAAADEHGIAMVFTGIRHFRH